MSMNSEIIAAFCIYAIVTSITPGPTNFMLLASGANFGFVRTIPHFLGVAFGFTIMVAAVGLGIGVLLSEHPRVYLLLKIAGITYLLYLSWCLLRATDVSGSGKATLKPMNFFMGSLFPLVNPKAWIMAIGAIGTYVPSGSSIHDVLLIALIFGAFNAPCMAVWAGFGEALSQALTRPLWRRIFNVVMALMLAISTYPIAVSEIARH
jgi:threonine/homoserine/homoserine lactone efflux protein